MQQAQASEPVVVRTPAASYLLGEQGLLCLAVQVVLAVATLWPGGGRP